MAMLLHPPGEPSHFVMVSSIRALQLPLWTNQTRLQQLSLGISRLPRRETLPLPVGTAPQPRVSRTSGSSARPAHPCEPSSDFPLKRCPPVVAESITPSRRCEPSLIELLSLCRLTSAVAEHRRSVRPSRRTQGSRNPLRALAAREDIRQDLMGDRGNAALEEESRLQAEKSKRSFILFLKIVILSLNWFCGTVHIKR